MPILMNLLTFLSTAKKIKAVVEDIQNNDDMSDIAKSHVLQVAQVKAVEAASVKSFLQSKKLWVTVCGVLIPVLNSKFGWGLNATEIGLAIAPLMSYVVGQGIADKK